MSSDNVRYATLQEAIYDQHAPEFDPHSLNDGLPSPAAVGSLDSSLGRQNSPRFPGKLRYEQSDDPDPSQKHPMVARTRKHPLFDSFEAPRWSSICLHSLLCVVAYPLLMVCVVISRDRTLFLTRFIVGLGCGLIGAGLSLSILQMGKQYIEAATWATVIHQSAVLDAPGIKLKDLAAHSGDPTSALAGLKLLWNRARFSGASRYGRRNYDRRAWTLYIIFFLFLTTLAASIPFTLGRLVDISATLTFQPKNWEEVIISAVNSPDDITNAKELAEPFNNFALAWTLSLSSRPDFLPPVAALSYENDTVYFSETTLPQLVPGGYGIGTFDTRHFNSSMLNAERPAIATTRNTLQPIDPGYVLRYPKWGTRLHCVKLPDPEINIIPKANSNSTYMFTPRQVLRDLFASFNLNFDETIFPTLTTAGIIKGNVNDTLPASLDPAAVAMSGVFNDDGASFSFFSRPVSMGRDGKGWVIIEEVLVRLNTSYAPSAKFARLGNPLPDANGNLTWIGYDAAICLQLFEPWVVDTYNGTTGVPSARRIVGAGNQVHDLGEMNRKHQFGRIVTDPAAARELNSSNLEEVFVLTHSNSMNSLLKDRSFGGFFYAPSQTLISFTGGAGVEGYTELSPDVFSQARGRADAIYILPYFAGSGKLVARRYPDQVLASASISPIRMILYLASVLIIGIIAGLFVPKLPLGVPRRDFQLYSWLAMFCADELVSVDKRAIERNMELEDIEKHVGNLRFRYVNQHATSKT